MSLFYSKEAPQQTPQIGGSSNLSICLPLCSFIQKIFIDDSTMLGAKVPLWIQEMDKTYFMSLKRSHFHGQNRHIIKLMQQRVIGTMIHGMKIRPSRDLHNSIVSVIRLCVIM